jgi:hypothetical protein
MATTWKSRTFADRIDQLLAYVSSPFTQGSESYLPGGGRNAHT